MTREELLALRPGDLIRRKRGRREERLVVSGGKHTNTRGGVCPIGLLKIGHSWTDPRPTAWYDAWLIQAEYVVTGRRGCPAPVAEALRNYKPPKKKYP